MADSIRNRRATGVRHVDLDGLCQKTTIVTDLALQPQRHTDVCRFDVSNVRTWYHTTIPTIVDMPSQKSGARHQSCSSTIWPLANIRRGDRLKSREQLRGHQHEHLAH